MLLLGASPAKSEDAVMLDFPNTPSLSETWPSPPVAGLPVWTWDGEKWVSDIGGSGASIIIADTAPSIAYPPGTLWWDSTNGELFVLFDDGVSSQWVAASPAGPAGLAAVSRCGLEPRRPTDLLGQVLGPKDGSPAVSSRWR